MFQDKITKNIATEVSKIKTEVKEVEVNENSVEGSASKIMGEELKGNQHKIDANNNNKIDAHDFKLLRAKKKVQETTDTPGNSYEHQCALHVKSEQFGEGRTLFSQHAEPDSDGNIEWYDVMFEEGIKRVNTEDLEILVSESHGNHKKKMKESVELDEVKMSDLPSRKIEGKSYGATTKQGNPFDVLKGPKETDLKKIEKEKKKKSFSEMIQQYSETGLKTIQEWSNKEVSEESEQIDEVGDTPAGKKVLSSYVNKALGDKNREKGLRKATSRLYKDNYYGKKNEEVEQVDEREMTDAEMAKREEIVKSMKKGMKGFKDRYGDRAKNVMYATATKQAMKD